MRFELGRAPHGVKIDPSTGLLEWPHPEEGTHHFTIQVSDGRGGSDSQAFQVFVGGKRPPRAQR